MKKKISYVNEPMQAKIVKDFLPPPEELVRKEDAVKVTISLSKSTVEFFKESARRSRTQYQKMIRRLLDLYASHHQ
jgi:hypothetical protein